MQSVTVLAFVVPDSTRAATAWEDRLAWTHDTAATVKGCVAAPRGGTATTCAEDLPTSNPVLDNAFVSIHFLYLLN